MKKIFFIISISITCIYYFSCTSRDEVTSPGSPTIISGTIINWHYGSDKKLYVTSHSPDSAISPVIIDTVSISSNGGFSFELKNPPDSLFKKFNVSSNCINNVQLNPPDMKWQFLTLNVRSDTGFTGFIHLSSDSLPYHPDQIFAYYAYFNSSGSISGKDSCIDTLTTAVTVYDLNITGKTWTNITNKFLQITSTHFETTVSTKPESLQWYFVQIIR